MGNGLVKWTKYADVVCVRAGQSEVGNCQNCQEILGVVVVEEERRW